MNRGKFARTVLAAALVGAVAAGWATGAAAQGTIKMGALATLEGPFTVLGQDSMRGVELALKEYNYTAGGKKIELIKGSSNASPDSAVSAARKLGTPALKIRAAGTADSSLSSSTACALTRMPACRRRWSSICDARSGG